MHEFLGYHCTRCKFCKQSVRYTVPSGPVIFWRFFIIDMSDYKRRNDAVPKIRSIPAGGNRTRSEKDRYGSFFVPEKSAKRQEMISQTGQRKDEKKE